MHGGGPIARWWWLPAAGITFGAAVAVLLLTATGEQRPGTDGPDGAAPTVPDSPSAGRSPAAGDPTASPSPTRPGAFVIWARGELTPRFAETLAAIPEVTAAAHVRSETAGLVGSRTADDTPADVLPEGYRVPVEVAAVDPVDYAPTLSVGPTRDAIASLGPGQALLSETGAGLRGVGTGGEIDLEGLRGLDVLAVVPDATVGRAEIVVHAADGGDVGLDDDGTVFLRHTAAPGGQTSALRDTIASLVPSDVTARIVDVTAGGPARRAPLVLSLTQVKERFGEFAFRPRPGVREIDVDPAFEAEHIITADVRILGSVTCHEDIVGDLRGALRRIDDAGLSGEIDPDQYGGCYYPRRISTSRDRLSHHSWGIALDINVDLSLPDLGPPPHPEVIAAFEAHGFRWGGDFLHADNHHFEWVGEVTAPPPTSDR